MIATETLEQTNLKAETFGDAMDQDALLKSLTEMGADGFALQQRAELLIQNPEALLELLANFETMKADTLASIAEWFGKVDAAGRERLLAAKELLKFVKLAIEALSLDALEALRDAAAGGKELAQGLFLSLFTHRGRVGLVIAISLMLASCATIPPAIKTAVAPDVAYAAGNGTPTATVAPPLTREPTRVPATPRPTNTPRPTEAATEVSTKLKVLSEAPPEMDEYYALGLDKQTLDGKSMKVVMLESTTKFGEVKWKNKLIQVWTEVLFTIDGQPVRGIVVNQWFDFANGYTYVVESGNGVTISKGPRSPKAVEDPRRAMLEFTPSDTPIVTLEFGSTGNELTDKVFEDAFTEDSEEYTGQDSELVFILGVGWVLPTTHIDISDAMSK